MGAVASVSLVSLPAGGDASLLWSLGSLRLPRRPPLFLAYEFDRRLWHERVAFLTPGGLWIFSFGSARYSTTRGSRSEEWVSLSSFPLRVVPGNPTQGCGPPYVKLSLITTITPLLDLLTYILPHLATQRFVAARFLLEKCNPEAGSSRPISTIQKTGCD